MRWIDSADFSQFPKFKEWCLSFNRTESELTVHFKVGQHSVPPFPTSEDYYQFCKVMTEEHDSLEALFLFHELFTRDPNDCITGLTDYKPYDYSDFTFRDYHPGYIADSFHAVCDDDWINKYDKLSLWANYIKNRFVIYKANPFPTNLCALFVTERYKFFFANKFIFEAIKYNFAESNPNRELLLSRVILEKDMIPTETKKWYCTDYDYSTEFDPAILVTLKPGLVAYAKDLTGIVNQRDKSIFPEFDSWYCSVVRSTSELDASREFKRYPIPPFPKSEDYKQLCNLLGYERDSLDSLMIFHEIFTRDAEDRIVGLTDYKKISSYQTGSLNIEHENRLMQALRHAPTKNWVLQYDKLLPWVDDLWHTFVYDTVCSRLVCDLFRLFCGNQYKFVYFDRLVSEAIKHNFAEHDPDRELLLRHVNVKRRKTVTEASKWYRTRRDFRTEFDPVLLTMFKSGLMAYAGDLKVQKSKHWTNED